MAIPSGPNFSKQADMSGQTCSVVGAEPGQPDVQGSQYLFLKYGYERSHLWRNFGIIIAMMIIFCLIHLLAAEYIHAQRSKGDVLLFQHGHAKGLPHRAHGLENNASLVFAQDINKQEGSHTDTKGFESVQTLLQQSSVFQWRNLSYDVHTKSGAKRILNNINGWVKPGELTALMVRCPIVSKSTIYGGALMLKF